MSELRISKPLLADTKLSLAAKLLLATLLDHCNKRTGQCNPRQATLARELGISNRTVIRTVAELCRQGWIEIARGQNGNRYEFPKCQVVTSQVTNLVTGKCQIVTSGPSGPLYEPTLRNLARSPRAAPPQKKSVQSEALARYYAQERRKAAL